MQKTLYPAFAAILLSITACSPESRETAEPAQAQIPTPPPQQTAAETPPPAALAASPVATPAEAPSAPVQSAATEKPAAPAAKFGVLTQEQALALAKKSNCLACHKLDTKLIGPAWNAVGAKYQGNANAAKTIAANIKKGGSFGWKLSVMPPRGGGMISDADIDSLAAFIATLK